MGRSNTSARRNGLARALALVGLAAALLLAGCAAQPPRQTAQEGGGVLRWSLEGVGDIVRLDPARPADYQTNIPLGLIFSGLVRLDRNLKVQGAAAERWAVSDDGTVFTFTLRENLRFGDGSPATADAVVRSLSRSISPATGRPFAAEFLKGIVGVDDFVQGKTAALEGVRAVDPRTVEIRLSSPQAYFLSQLTYAIAFIVPPDAIEQAGDEWKAKAYGTGPFRVGTYEAGNRLLLEPNPYYWDRAPGVEAVEFRFFPDISDAVDAYLAGEVDIMGTLQAGVPAERLEDVRGRPGLQTISAPAVRYIGFNNSRPPFDNVFIRQAFARAVDKRGIAEDVLAGSVNVADRILPPDLPGADIPIDRVAFDPEGARGSLVQAGYLSGGELPPVTLTYPEGQGLDGVAARLQTDWRDTLGVDVRLEPVSLTEFNPRLDAMVQRPEEGMDLYLSIWGMDYPDPQNFLSLQLHSGSPYNNGHWENPEFDRLTEEADVLGDPRRQDERLRLYNQAEELAVQQVGWLPLFYPQASVLIRPGVRGLLFTSVGIIAPDWAEVRAAPAAN